jgi:hypothetical protein
VFRTVNLPGFILIPLPTPLVLSLIVATSMLGCSAATCAFSIAVANRAVVSSMRFVTIWRRPRKTGTLLALGNNRFEGGFLL